MITPEVTTMRGAAAPASFSLNLLSTLLKQTRSSAMNASSLHERAHEPRKGAGRMLCSEWKGVGVASRNPEPAPLRDVAACCSFVARRRYQTLERSDLVSPVPSLCIAAPARRNRPHLPWRNRVVSLVQRAPFLLRRVASFSRSARIR